MKIFPNKIYRYYYDPNTGVFRGSSYKMTSLQWQHLPYIERPQFDYGNYRVDVNTGDLIHDPQPTNPR